MYFAALEHLQKSPGASLDPKLSSSPLFSGDSAGHRLRPKVVFDVNTERMGHKDILIAWRLLVARHQVELTQRHELASL